MELKLTRRQFGQLALAGATVSAIGMFDDEAFAQQPSTVVLGVRPGNTSSNDTLINLDSKGDGDEIRTAGIVPSSLQSIVVQSFNVINQQIGTVLTTPAILESGEQLSGFTSLKDGRLVVATTNVNTDKKKKENVRLIFLDKSSPKTVAVSGLQKNEALHSLLLLNDGTLAGLVSNINGMPPSRVVTINPDTGEIRDKSKISDQKRVTAIVQCSDGTFYGLATEKTGETYLFQADQAQLIKLNFNGQPWNSGFSSLVCAKSNQLFALGALRYEYPFYLHTFDLKTGEIKRIEQGFDVSVISISLNP
jgi:hypothetical protein